MRQLLSISLVWLTLTMVGVAEVPTGKYSAKSEEPSVRSLEFLEGEMVDVTSIVKQVEIKNGRPNTVSKTSTVRLSYLTHDLKTFDVKALEKNGSNKFTEKLREYQAAGYEELIYLKNGLLDVYVRKGNELVSIPAGYVFKKPWF